MKTSRARAVAFMALAVLLGVIAGAAPGHAKCDPTTDPDGTDIANARAAVAANCNCAGATSHGVFVSCAAQQANLTLVNKSCAGAVKRCAAHSTCGKPTGAVTCCVTKAGATKCKIKRDAARCTAPPGATACVGGYTSCCDACGAAGCATTTTTTTTTYPSCSSPLGVCGSCPGSGICVARCDDACGLVCVSLASASQLGCTQDSQCGGEICAANPSFCSAGVCSPGGTNGTACALPCP